MNVAIALPVLAEGDAIGHDVLGMAATLRAAGHTVMLHAEKSLIADDVLPLTALIDADASPDDLLIYHHSHGSEAGVRALRSWPGRAVVKYHNVTPARYFQGGDPAVRAAAEAGLAQATELSKAFPFWVDSAFNGRGLPGACHELPPFMPTEALRQQEPDAGFASRLDDWATTLLCVGRVAPNKNLLLAIDALKEYRDRFDGSARLIIAGGHVFPEYSEAVQARIIRNGLEGHVAITGRVSAAQLKALYLAADALLVTSDHEGFCVPLVEAMALGVPTVAMANTAIPETAGPFAAYAAGNAHAVAEAAHHLVANRGVRERHVHCGHERYEECFTPAAIGRRFLHLLETLRI